MSYLKIALVVCACVAISAAQYEQFGLDYSGGFLPTSFGAPSLMNMLSAASARDPRANRGPVVFPPSPPGDPSQTSGVVAGASGFGFVPPGSQADWGWTQTEEEWQPLWTTQPSIWEAARELVKCGCKNSCRGRCSCRREGMPCTLLCKSCYGNCDNTSAIDREALIEE